MEEIVLFGIGKYFETKIKSIKKKYKIIMCIDNSVSPSKSKTIDDSISVINPINLKNENNRIFLMSVNFIPMWRQLVELGVDTNRIVFPFDISPYFENDEVILNGIKEIVFEKDFISFIDVDNNVNKIFDEVEWRAYLRELYRKCYPLIDAVSSMSTIPISCQFGTERGTPVDRIYIEKFLSKYREYIYGDVLEIEDAFYTKKYGVNVSKSIVMDVDSEKSNISFNANLETGEGICDGIADCFILTQTLMYIYDLKSAVDNIYRLLKTNGTALITCSGISQNSRRCMDDYGCVFNFNSNALNKMFKDRERFEIIDSGSYGNVKTVTAHIAGLCAEELVDEDFEYNDKYYPLVVYIVVRRVN